MIWLEALAYLSVALPAIWTMCTTGMGDEC